MDCRYQEVRKLEGGKTEYRCPWCGHERVSEHPPEKIFRRCPVGPNGSPVPSMYRPKTEVLYIISNHCQMCPFYNEPKQACELCGCPSSKGAKNYLRPRNRQCPAGRWTEASLQKLLHPNPQKTNLDANANQRTLTTTHY